MPELPEVETVRAGLAPAMTGRRIVRAETRRAGLRYPFAENFIEMISGQTVTAVSRRAKYLLFEFADQTALLAHLGMSGSFRVEDWGDGSTAAESGMRHDHVIFHLSDQHRIIYNDPRRFGFMDLIGLGEKSTNRFLSKLGIEPLGNQLSATYLADKFAGRQTSIKAALLDQQFVAGLGNIYVSEVLHRCGISPTRAVATLVRKNGQPRAELAPMPGAIRQVLLEAIEAGGSTLNDHRQTDGSLGYFQHRFRVYDRAAAPCPTANCRGTIERIVQNGRSTFYCRKCQK